MSRLASLALVLTACQGAEVVPVIVGHAPRDEPPVTELPRSRLEACLAAPASLGRDAQAIRKAFCQELTDREIPGGALAIVRADGSIESLAFGRRCSDTEAPVTSTTGFRVGSLTKSMLAAGAVALAASDRLDLDAPLGRTAVLAIDLDPSLADASLRELLDHHAGLADHLPTPALRGADRSAVLRALVGEPIAAPGETWTYANGGYALAAARIEDTIGVPIAAVLRREVLAPLQLANAAMVPPEPVPTDVACGHLRDATGRWQPQRIADDFDRLAFAVAPAAAAGAMVAGVDELGRFAGCLADAALACPSWAAELRAQIGRTAVATDLAPHAAYALGLDVGELADGTRVLEHRGDTGDFAAQLVALPDRRVAFVMVLGASARLPATRAAFLGWAGVDPRRPAAAMGSLAGYVGRYRDRGGHTIEVVARDGVLALRRDHAPPVDLVHVEHHGFTAAGTTDALVFVRDGDAPARALRSATWFARRIR